jgi:hypothetical protein
MRTFTAVIEKCSLINSLINFFNVYTKLNYYAHT